MKNTLSIFSDIMNIGRPPTSVHGKLFGGDSLFEVLTMLAANRAKKFTVLRVDDTEIVALADAIGRTVTQTRREVRKLEAIGVLEEVERAAEDRGVRRGRERGGRAFACATGGASCQARHVSALIADSG